MSAWGMTRDRVTTLVIVAAAIAVGTWIAFHTYWTQVTVTTPLKGEAATNPYYSVERLVRALGMRAEKISSLRMLPSGHDVLLVTDLRGDLAHTPLESVERWVEAGGRLAVTSGVVWSMPALQRWSGIAPAHQDPVVPRKDSQRAVIRVVPAIDVGQQTCAPLAVQVQGHPTGDTLELCVPPTAFGFVSKRVPSWAASSEQGLQLLRVEIGRGSVTVIGSDFQLNPRIFLRGDDARALIEGSQLKRGERLLIFSPNQGEPLLAMLWRLAAPAIVCFALAAVLLIWRHLPRFGPRVPESASARRSLAEQLRANARFAWRTQKLKSLRMAVLHALDRDAARRVPGYRSMSTRQRAGALASRAGIDAGRLNAAMTGDAVGSPAVQRDAITLLEHARRALHSSLDTRQSA
jgi:hypothetical protein